MVLENTITRMLDPKRALGGDGYVHQHYPLALRDLFAGRLAAAREVGSAAYTSALNRINTMLKHPLYNYRPLPQATAFHKSRSTYRWIIGGNRSSKSHALAHEVYWLATGTHPYREEQLRLPCIGWYAAPTWDLVGQILMVKMDRLLSHLRMGRDYQVLWHNKAKRVPDTIAIRVRDSVTGQEAWSKIVFKAYEQGGASFYGTERAFVGCDEQFPHDVYYEMITRIGAEVDMLFMAAFTPLLPQAWLEEKLNGAADPPPGWDVFNFPLDDNRISRGGFIKDAAIDQMIDEWPEEMQETRRMGRWGAFVGLVYKTWSRDIHVINEQRERDEKFLEWRPNVGHCCVPPTWPTTGAVDFGAVNPFCHLWACPVPHMDNAWYIYDEYYWHGATQGTRLISEHANEILARDAYWHATVRQRFSDHDVQDRAELHANGVPTQPARKDVRAGIECVQKWLKVHGGNRPRLFVAARCKNVIREFATYRWPDSTGPRDPKDVPIAKDDHAMDAIRYLLYSSEHALPAGHVTSNGAFKRAVR